MIQFLAACICKTGISKILFEFICPPPFFFSQKKEGRKKQKFKVKNSIHTILTDDVVNY